MPAETGWLQHGARATTAGKCSVLPRPGKAAWRDASSEVAVRGGEGAVFQRGDGEGAGGRRAGGSGGCRRAPNAEVMCRPDSRIKTLLRKAGTQF